LAGGTYVVVVFVVVVVDIDDAAGTAGMEAPLVAPPVSDGGCCC